ncbi:UNVERIFIED_CONTAM: hypothetical protein O8I53_05710 [Campylobacter lari]
MQPRDIELIFADLSKRKLALKAELETLGYFQVKDIKALSNAKLKILSSEKAKMAAKAFERFKFVYSNIKLFASVNNSVYSYEELKNSCNTDKIIYSKSLEQGKITQEEFDEKIQYLDQSLLNYHNVSLLAININNDHIKKIKHSIKHTKSSDEIETAMVEIERITKLNDEIKQT